MEPTGPETLVGSDGTGRILFPPHSFLMSLYPGSKEIELSTTVINPFVNPQFTAVLPPGVAVLHLPFVIPLSMSFTGLSRVRDKKCKMASKEGTTTGRIRYHHQSDEKSVDVSF